jgi:hypothetical protein
VRAEVRARWRAFVETITCPACGDSKGHAGILPSSLVLCVKCGHRQWTGRRPSGTRPRQPPRVEPSDLERIHALIESILSKLDADRTVRLLQELRSLPPDLARLAVEMGCRAVYEADCPQAWRLPGPYPGPLTHGVATDPETLEFKEYRVLHGPAVPGWTWAFWLPMSVVDASGWRLWHDVQYRLYYRRATDAESRPRFVMAHSNVNPDYPRLGFSHIPAAGEPRVVAVCEGFFKAVACRSLWPDWDVIWTAGTVGQRSERLVEYVRRLRPQAVVVVPDADIWSNGQVADSVIQLASALVKARIGLDRLFAILWPSSAGKGIDDVVVRGAADVLEPWSALELAFVLMERGLLGEASQKAARRWLNRRALLVASMGPSEPEPPPAVAPSSAEAFHRAWADAFQRARCVVDTSGTGFGKTFAAVSLRRTDIPGVKRIVVLAQSPLNLPVQSGRHHPIVGRTHVGWAYDTTARRWRWARPGEPHDPRYPPNCPYTLAIAKALDTGAIYNATRDWCERTSERAGPCRYLQDCRYLKQFESDVRYVVMHPDTYMHHVRAGDLVIIDEFPESAFLDSVQITKDLLQDTVAALDKASLPAWLEPVRGRLRKFVDRVGYLVRTGRADELERYLAFMRPYLMTDVDLLLYQGLTRDEAAEIYRAAILHRIQPPAGFSLESPLRDALAWIVALVRVLRGQGWRVGLAGDGSAVVTAPRPVWQALLGAERDVRVLVLSATPDLELLTRVFGEVPLVIGAPHAALPVVVQVVGLPPLRNRPYKRRLQAHVRAARQALAIVRRTYGADGPVGILTLKRHVAAFREAFPEAAIGWFGADERGTNRYADCQILIVSGLLIRNLGTVLARGGLDASKLRDLEFAPRRLATIGGADLVLLSPQASDPDVERVVAEEIRRNYLQAAGRLRQARSDAAKFLIITDPIWTGLPVSHVLIARRDPAFAAAVLAARRSAEPSLDRLRSQAAAIPAVSLLYARRPPS